MTAPFLAFLSAAPAHWLTIWLVDARQATAPRRQHLREQRRQR